MEETSTIQLISIFLSSHLLEDAKIDIYQTDDTLLERISINNYDSKTIKINKQVQSFYCVATNSVHMIEEQFQCDFKQLLKQNERPTIQKQFQTFKLDITIQLTQQSRTSVDQNYQQKTDDLIMSYALSNIKKIQKKILKQMELSQLKKPIKPSSKFTHKNTSVEKVRTNICFAGTSKKRLSSQKKLVIRNSKKLQTAYQAPAKPIQVQEEENNEDNRSSEVKSKRGAKHKTLTYQREQMFEDNSTKQIQIKQNKTAQLPMYDLILQLFSKSLTENKKIVKNHRNRVMRKSYNDLLLLQTKEDLQMQNQILNVIHSSNDYLKFTPLQSRVNPTPLKSLGTSPYKVSSKTFRKRKVF